MNRSTKSKLSLTLLLGIAPLWATAAQTATVTEKSAMPATQETKPKAAMPIYKPRNFGAPSARIGGGTRGIPMDIGSPATAPKPVAPAEETSAPLYKAKLRGLQ